MLKINKKIEYALIALKYMAQKREGELTSARELYDLFKTPFDTTAKVMQAMNQAKLLYSVKGIKGGYGLAKDLKSITYIELAKLIEGKDFGSFCQNSKGLCDLYETCNIITPLDQLNHKLNDFLSHLTLHELLLGDFEIKTQADLSKSCAIEEAVKL